MLVLLTPVPAAGFTLGWDGHEISLPALPPGPVCTRSREWLSAIR